MFRPAQAQGVLPVVAAAQDEQVSVIGGTATDNGVTNTTAGGGLMAVQTVPRSQSGVTRDFIAKQSPTANVQSLIADLPGVITSNNDPLGITGDALRPRLRRLIEAV